MKYLFILGRNVELSIAEVLSYFGEDIINYSLEKNAMLVEIRGEISEETINDFGGVISIGKVISSGQADELISDLEKKEIYLGKKNNFNYCLWNFSDSIDQISSYLKKRFRSEKLKATEKNFTGRLKLQSGETVEILASKLVGEQFFVFGKENLYFGKIIATCNYEELEKRDMEKPVRRESLSISPRLAKIMINLSQIKKDQNLLDSFCGVGVILQEALLRKIKVFGMDKDRKAIDGARKNLEWQNFPKENYNLTVGDSSKRNIPEVNVIVSEPDFGDTLKKIPTKEKAQKMLKNYENLMIKVINNLKNNVSGRIVFTAPLIRIGKKRLSCDADNILSKTGLKFVEIKDINLPIQEFRDKQIVGREIFVLER